MQVTAVVGAAVIAASLAVLLKQIRGEYAIVVSIAAGCLLSIWAVDAAAPVVQQISDLVSSAELEIQNGEILIKSLGIAVLTQLGIDVCRDAGETAIASKVELCGRVAITLICLPLLGQVLAMAKELINL